MSILGNKSVAATLTGLFEPVILELVVLKCKTRMGFGGLCGWGRNALVLRALFMPWRTSGAGNAVPEVFLRAIRRQQQ